MKRSAHRRRPERRTLPSSSRRAVLFLVCLALACAGGAVGASAVESSSASARPDPSEHARNVETLRPPKRERPLIAVLANNSGTETTDFLVPYGVLSESGLADVVAVAPDSGPVELMPALRIRPDQSLEEFDRRYPEGADYVIVPAMHDRDDSRILDWIRGQADTGAILVAICSGAMVVSQTGLLADHAITTHWFDVEELARENPTATVVENRRYVVDRGIVTTTGVTASVPVSLLLVEAIGGRTAAVEVANRLGATDWSATHDSAAFRFEWRWVRIGLGNWLAFWRHERLGIAVGDGVDEIGLALVADATARTFRSEAVTVSKTRREPRTRHGLVLLADEIDADAGVDRMVDEALVTSSTRALDGVLRDMLCRYGEPVATFVAVQLEYPAEQLHRDRRDVAAGVRPCGEGAMEHVPQPSGSPSQTSGVESRFDAPVSRKIVPSETVIAQRI